MQTAYNQNSRISNAANVKLYILKNEMDSDVNSYLR